MKLSSVLYQVNKALPLLESVFVSEVTINGINYKQIQEANNIKNALELLKSTSVFDDRISSFQDTLFYGLNDRFVNVSPNEYSKLAIMLSELISVVSGVKNVLEKLVADVPSNSLYVKLPIVEDLEDFKKSVDSFTKIFSLVLMHPDIDADLKFLGVESGSNWFKVFVRTTTAVSLIGSLMWSAMVVYKKYQEAKLIEQVVREQEIQNDHKENLVNAHKALTDLTIRFEAENLYKKYYKKGEIDNEQIERIKTSLRLLSEEISRGGEINPALTAPEEVSNLFPDIKSLPLIESKFKKIENK